MKSQDVEVAIVGAGIAGIATAYYLCLESPKCTPVIIDPRAPMSLTSAQSGENYRNWWPHRTMTDFTDRSIDLMEKIARDSGNRLHMTRRGYALATRAPDIDGLIAELHAGYGTEASDHIRIHKKGAPGSYKAALSADWEGAPDGVDVIQDQGLIRQAFPSFDAEIKNVLHIRRAGDISGQQMGEFMLERIKKLGGRRVVGSVTAMQARPGGFALEVADDDGVGQIRAEKVVNAAGPFAKELAAMLGITLPVETLLQQKIAFDDHKGAISRQMPFAIDLDARTLDWTAEERELLADDEELAWLVEAIPGGIHCRPDGGDHGTWIKLGWAFNRTPGEAAWEPGLNPQFPEIVLRGAAALNASLKTYYGSLPRGFSHYGGYYAMTRENWPLIGPMGVEGAYVVGALSGFGTMSACAAGELCAAWILGKALPHYAEDLSPARYDNAVLMSELEAAASKGVL